MKKKDFVDRDSLLNRLYNFCRKFNRKDNKKKTKLENEIYPV